MRKIQSILQQASFKENSIPLALLGICILAFGILIPGLGFYMDDWPYVFYAFNKGIASLKISLAYDSRPNAAWLYMLAFQILGFKPLFWHITMLVLRWLTVILMWSTLKVIWPRRIREITYFAFLFSVYPFFMLQPFAVGSTHHWVGFIFYSLSLLLMLYAASRKELRISATVGAVLLEGIHLFTSEYFAGLELLRPIILWILISRSEQNRWKAIRSALIKWLPYLFMLALFAFWRVAIYEPPEGISRNTPTIVYQLMEEPLEALSFLFYAASTDAISVLTTGWQLATDVKLFHVSSLFGGFRLALSALGLYALFLYLEKLVFTVPSQEDAPDDWPRKAPLFAVAALLVAGMPQWLIGRTLLESKNLVSASRFGLTTMVGASLIIILLITSFVSDRRKLNFLLAAVLALALNFHLNNEKSFRDAWEKQIRFYQQITWRAPEIQPATAIITDMEILGYMGQYATALGINTAYELGNARVPSYWYFPVYYTYDDIDLFVTGIPIHDSKLTMFFNGQSTDSLIISFDPELDRCLWILSPEDQHLRLISDDMRLLSTVSSIERIGDNKGIERVLPEEIFREHQNQGWCYYFERADLARQFSRWDEVLRLWNQAQAAGEQAGNGYEYIPFIEGLAHNNDWSAVRRLTRTANQISKGLEPSLCNTLDRIKLDTPASPERDQTTTDLKEQLDCINYQ